MVICEVTKVLAKDDTLLSVDEVATIIKADQYTVRRWLREGRLKGVKSLRGGQWLVKRGDLLAAAPELQDRLDQRGQLVEAFVALTGLDRAIIEEVLDDPRYKQ